MMPNQAINLRQSTLSAEGAPTAIVLGGGINGLSSAVGVSKRRETCTAPCDLAPPQDSSEQVPPNMTASAPELILKTHHGGLGIIRSLVRSGVSVYTVRPWQRSRDQGMPRTPAQ
jgi:hypothetical protein